MHPIQTPDEQFVSCLIAKHEDLVSCPHAVIHIKRLQVREHLKEFLAEEFYPEYFPIFDAEFQKQWDDEKQKQMLAIYAGEIVGVKNYVEHNMTDMLYSFGRENFNRGVESFLFWLLSNKMSDIMPLMGKDNAFEPMVQLLDAGYLPRRVKSGWIVGYRTKEDTWKGIVFFGRRML